MNINNNFRNAIICVAFLTLAFAIPVYSQPPPPPPVETPIDGGITLFLAAGVAAGSKILFDKNKKRK